MMRRYSMNGKPLRRRDDGVAGYFEDLPKLLFILFAVGIFLISTVTAYRGYNEYNRKSFMVDNLNSFSVDLIDWEKIAPQRTGLLDLGNLEILSLETLTEEFHPAQKGFEYELIIIDSSIFETRYGNIRFNTTQRPIGVDIYAKTVPVLVEDYSGNYRASKLIVSIWET